jgi:hypothetical protein
MPEILILDQPNAGRPNLNSSEIMNAILVIGPREPWTARFSGWLEG